MFMYVPQHFFSEIEKGALRADYEYLSDYKNEIQIMSWKALESALTLSNPECCDIQKRLPSNCFLPFSPIPRPNVIQARHFSQWADKMEKEGVHVSRKKFGWLCVNFDDIIRTVEYQIINEGKTTDYLHGKVKETTKIYDTPLMTKVYNWASMTQQERRKAYLHAIEKTE
uniref:Uncharacterized protein n=1 Tax=Aplanochytrium stocchinoi TaxID=215587 RepID=A0A7S3LQT5_9STRA